jgi:hypothetical protein
MRGGFGRMRVGDKNDAERGSYTWLYTKELVRHIGV